MYLSDGTNGARLDAPIVAEDNASSYTSSSGSSTSSQKAILKDLSTEKLTLLPQEQIKLKRRALFIICGLVLVNAAALVLLFVLGAEYPTLTSPGILAFTFGLRHAVDADHIAAIDNVTRKLVQDGKWPLTVGLWFSLGHSSVVTLMCISLVAGSSYAEKHLSAARRTGGLIGTAVSSSVLFIFGVLNLLIAGRLLQQRRALKKSREDSSGGEELHVHHQLEDDHIHEMEVEHGHTHIISVDADAQVTGGGVLTTYCPRLFRFVDSPEKMYPIGFLFGLGFDTASEVSLLALAIMSSKEGIPALCNLVLPLMFSVGMAFIDTLDGLMMLWAYGWAAIDPSKRLFFNLFLTVASAIISLFVGCVEALGVLQDKFHLKGIFWNSIKAINDHFELLGYSIMVFFLLSSLAAVIMLRRS